MRPQLHGTLRISLLYPLFFLSGASALIYEVLWVRMLALVLGGNSFGIATVLSAFMGGLALGSWLVWLSAYVQRMFIEEDIRAACQRVMPDTVQRCIDTVVIQRGGARR